MKTTRATIEPADLANVKNLERLAAEVREFRDLKARYLAAEARIVRLEEALRQHGHKDDCRSRHLVFDEPCDCGLDAALEGK